MATETMITPNILSLEDLKQSCRALFDRADGLFAEKLVALYYRWGEERKYEEWSDYVKIIQGLVEDIIYPGEGFRFEKATGYKPFSCLIYVGENTDIRAHVLITVTADRFKIEVKTKKLN